VLLEHRLDARCARAAFDPCDRLAARDEHDRGRDLHRELGDEIRPLLEVDLNDAQTMSLLASDVREETLHPPRRARTRGGEEDEQGPGIVRQECLLYRGVQTPMPSHGDRLNRGATLAAAMGDWYSIGILVGLGAAIGVATTGTLRRAPVAVVVAAALAVAVGFAFWQWDQAVGGLAGAVCGALGSAPLVAGTLRRGGTRGGTALLLGLAALAAAALAFVPVVGYLEALAVPVLGARLRRRSPDKHAGLRTLARD
jgi:hypothetical protein